MSELQDRLPWEIQPGEPKHWFDRFDKYAKTFGYEFTPRRAFSMYSLDIANRANEASDSYTQWVHISTEWRWAERARDWAEDERSRRRAKWEDRRMQLMEDDWTDGGSLRKFAQDALGTLQLFKETGKGPNGEIVLTAQVTPPQVATLMKVSSELQRLALGEPTDIQGHNDQIGPAIYLPEVDHVPYESCASSQ